MDECKQNKLNSLEIYRLSVEMALHVYKLTKKFPKEELYGLSSQIRRCAASIGANIAEGYGRYHYKDQSRFDYLARGSLFELLFHFELSKQLGYITESDFSEVEKLIRNLGVKLNNYINYLKKRN